MNRLFSAIMVGLLILPMWGCREAAEPVAEVTFEPTEVGLAYPGRAVARLQWKMSADLGDVDGVPLVFVHLLDEPGSVVRTFDHPLPFGWQPGEVREYELTLYQSALAPPLGNGIFDLSLGLYDRSGKRWPLTTGGSEVDEFEYQVAGVDTNGKPDEVPMFYFSPSWLPLEAGTDVQILGRRWLSGEGSIRVAEVRAPGSVWMRLRIPTPEVGVEDLSLAEGESEPTLVVGGNCGGEEALVRGVGFHEITVPVEAAAEGELPEECEIVLRPNFHLVEVKTLARRSLALEILSWSRG